MRRRADDDRASFEALYDAHGDAVLRYARRRTADPAAADDVVAETFLVAWRKLERIPEDPRGWLFAVARRVLANQRRSELRRDALAERLASEPEPEAVRPEDAGLAAALGQLSERDREALLLVHWDGLSRGEAARALGITALAFRSRLSRARKRLAAELGEPAAPHRTDTSTRLESSL